MDTNKSKRNERSLPAGRFKQHCLAILDEVADTHEPITITKHNKPVARVVPLQSDQQIEEEVLERLRLGGGGVVVEPDTLLEPTEQLAEWSQ